jgi:2-methylcitrate dehydratase PrpD
MVAMGFSAVEDPFSGAENIYTSLGDKPAPEKLLAELGSSYAVFGTTIKKWTVGAPLQSVLDSLAALLEDPGVRADNIRHISVDMPTASVRIVDNSTIPDLCLQHLVALMIVDRGATFASVHDVARMSDPRVLAVRKLVELVPSQELQMAVPARQAIVRIETADGRSLSRRTQVVRGTARNPMDAQEVEAKDARPDGARHRCRARPRAHRRGRRPRADRPGVRSAPAVAGIAVPLSGDRHGRRAGGG